jgi:hypothetical protein
MTILKYEKEAEYFDDERGFEEEGGYYEVDLTPEEVEEIMCYILFEEYFRKNSADHERDIKAIRKMVGDMSGKGIDFEEYEEEIRDFVQKSDRW